MQISFRKATSLKLSDAVKQYISTKYDQHPDMFSSDLAAIDQLRADAVNVQEVHVSGIHKLARYAGHLQWISGKFPIDVCRPRIGKEKCAHVHTVDRSELHMVSCAWI